MAANPPGVTFCPLDGGTAVRGPGDLDLGWSAEEIRRAAAGVAHTVRERQIDVLHFHYACPFALIAQEVRRQLGSSAPAVVGTLHGTDVTMGRDCTELRALRQALLGLDAMTTVADSYAVLAAATLGLPRVPVTIPNFIDLSRFYPLSVRTPGRPRVAHVSNFRAVKDPQRMSRIFLQVRKAVDAELWLVGDGAMMPAVRTILAECSDAGHVRFLGLRRDVRPILADSDLLLLTSREESFSMATLEAAACGVPTVAPDVGGLPEVVGDGGVLYAGEDETAARDAVLGLLGDPVRRRTMAQAALAQAKRFSADVIIPRYEALYQLVLAQRNVRIPAGRFDTDASCVR